MRTRSLLLIIAILILGMFALAYRQFLSTSSVTAQGAQPTAVEVIFPHEGIERAVFVRAFDSWRSIGPGYHAVGTPSTIYGKRMTLQEAQKLIPISFPAPSWNPSSIWLIVLEGQIVGYSESQSEQPLPITAQSVVVLDGTTGEHILSTLIRDQQRLDTSSFTRYALPTRDEYAFPEPQPTQIIATPIILNPAPEAPRDKGEPYPAPPKQP